MKTRNNPLLRLSFICLLAIGIFSSVSAKIQLSPLFTDNMVFQQQTDAPVWGKASPGKEVKITTSWDKQTYKTMATSDGSWKTTIKTPEAGGPYNISISDGKEIKLTNVMIGEVWICSGQSNMEMPLSGWGKITNYEQEIANANFPNIRLLHVDKTTSTQPQSELKVSSGGWKQCSPATIAEFSSVAYFFGRNLHQNMSNIPIGLINTSWGGTIAEAWTSGETLENMPYFRDAVNKIKSTENKDLQSTYEQDMKKWNEQVISADKGFMNNVPAWTGSEFNDSGWKEMAVPGVWEEKGLNNFDGIVWFRYTIDIPSDWVGKELEIGLGAIDDNEITYFNGEKIGAINGHDVNRKYKIPAKLVKNGKATITVRVTDTGGTGGFNGEPKEMYIRPLSGGNKTSVSLSGNWKYMIGANHNELPQVPQSPNNPNRPTVLYNAMIQPLVPYAIRGAIWYQGESNADRAYQYRELFPLMIRDWRKQWKSDFSFYYVQLANFMATSPEPQESDWAKLREAQLQTLHLENTGMAVTIDIGDAKDIHPKNKQDVGIRLALAARANTYGQKIAYSGPIYQSYKIEGNKIRISFSQTNNGLKAKDNKTLKGFAIAGADHKFQWATAVIEGNDVIVSSPDVPFPVAVRYAWADNPECNLYNGADLPASPFRTDDYTN